MYIWVGIDMDSQLQEIKAKTMEAEQRIGFSHSNFTLPLHVSLKISLLVEEGQFDAVVKEISEIYQSTEAFAVGVKSIDWEETIAWIRMEECAALNQLSLCLNTMLREKFGIPLHEYDLDYKFHTTLFMDDDKEKVKEGYESVNDCPVPSTLLARRFVIGVSETGALGTYRIYSVCEK